MRLEGDSSIVFSNANAKILLFGISATVADAPATVIDQHILAINERPAEFDLVWPENAKSLIRNPSVGESDSALFYINVTADVDGDGMLCQGDLIQDYDQTPFNSFPGRPGATTIVMKAQENDFAGSFPIRYRWFCSVIRCPALQVNAQLYEQATQDLDE